MWYWSATCKLCGYSTPFFKWQWVSKVCAMWHSLTVHPYGYCKISAVDKDKLGERNSKSKHQ